MTDEAPKPKVGHDGSFTMIDFLEQELPKLEPRQRAKQIKLFLGKISEYTAGKVLGFRSTIEFDKDGLMLPGQPAHNVLTLFGINVRFLPEIKKVFDYLGEGKNFSLNYVEHPD